VKPATSAMMKSAPAMIAIFLFVFIFISPFLVTAQADWDKLPVNLA
jgi:hypothetical protein